MKYKVTYIEQREVSVMIDIKDTDLNDAFEKLGPINSDSDFVNHFDKRWKIEEQAYSKYSSSECEEGDFAIIERRIEKCNIND